jgi:hypothetical protein
MNHPSPLRHDTDAGLPAAAYLRYESRSDGWSGGRQAAFLAHLADNGVVEDAAQSVGMSVSGGYALRRQARGFAFDLGWQAALILARRILSDRLMTAAIRGEEARWVREEGITTYTRQNTRLSMALLDRVNPANAAPEVLAVVVRFDCYLQMLDEGLNGPDLWELFFEEALPASDRETRARVCHSLLLCEDSADFEGEEEPPIEYKSMDGPPSPDGQPRAAHSLSSATSAPLRGSNFLSRRTRRRPEASRENAEIFDAAPLLSESFLGEVPALDQRRHHTGRDHQHTAIVKHPDCKADPARLSQRPCPREDQQVGGDKGHGAKADAVARKIAIPRTCRHPRNEQRIDRRLHPQLSLGGKVKGDDRREYEHRNRQQFLAEHRMHPPVAQEQYNGDDMADGKGNRAPDHVDLQQAIPQRPEGHHGGKQKELASVMFAQGKTGKQPHPAHLPRNRGDFGHLELP